MRVRYDATADCAHNGICQCRIFAGSAAPNQTQDLFTDIGMGSERKVSPWIAGAVCLVVGLGIGGLGMLAARRGGGLPAEELERLTVEAERSPLTLKIRVNGSVVPVRSVNLSPKNAGRLVATDR